MSEPDDLREVTQKERDKLGEEGVFDINGNLPFHPGYCHIHKKSNGTFVWRKRATFNTDAWYEEEEPITDPEDIELIESYLKNASAS